MATMPNLNDHFSRRAVRSAPNPLDKSTIISIYPKPVFYKNITVQPGEYFMPKGSWQAPSVMVIGPSSWWKDAGPHEPLIEITHSSIQMADSFVRDFCNGMLEVTMADAMPGLFFIPGEKNILEVRRDYSSLLDKAKDKQTVWYKKLIEQADILWARSQGNPLAVSDDMRLAAQEMGLKGKQWMENFSIPDLRNCPACGNLINPNFPVCQFCHHIVNAELYTKLGLKRAV